MKFKNLCFIFVLCLFSFLSVGCKKEDVKEYERLKQEDIKKWQKIEDTYKEEGYYDKDKKGSILVTKDFMNSSSFYIGHAAIMFSDNRIVEANPDKNGEVGVTSGVHFSNNDWNRTDKKDTCYQALPRVEENCEVVSEKQMEIAANWCEKQIGKHYFSPVSLEAIKSWRTERSEFYCSHLVWAGYNDAVGIDLAPGATTWVAPADLLNKNYVKVIYSRPR